MEMPNEAKKVIEKLIEKMTADEMELSQMTTEDLLDIFGQEFEEPASHPESWERGFEATLILKEFQKRLENKN